MLKHIIFFVINLSLFILTFSKTSFPALQRKFYFGGEFTQVYFYNSTSRNIDKIPVNNIASFDGAAGIWQYVGKQGTNGKVNEIHVDTCSNLFIGGKFTNVDDLETGPIAKFDIKTNSWTTIHAKTIKGPTYSRVVDCFNKPTTIECPCDVYLGGKFQASILATESVSGKPEIATNVMKYNYQTGKYDNLGGAEKHKLDIPANSEVKKIYKKQIGVFQNTLNYFWVGGSFLGSFTKYHVYNEKWGFDAPKFTFDSNSKVEDFYYLKGHLLDSDLIYVGGKYTINMENQKTCSNICVFEYNSETFLPVSSNQPDGTVYSIDFLASTRTLIIGGSFTNHGLGKIRSVVYPSIHAKFTNYVDDSENQIPYDVHSLSVCESRFCGFGSLAYASHNSEKKEELKFWSSEKKSFYNFGNGTDGIVNVIRGDYSLGYKIQTSVVLILICLIVSLS